MPPNFSGGGCIPRVQPSELPRAAPKLHIYVTKAVIGIAATGHAPPGHRRTTQSSTRTRRHDDGDDDDDDDDGDDSPAADDPYLVCIPYVPMVISSFYEIVSVVHAETRVHHGDGFSCTRITSTRITSTAICTAMWRQEQVARMLSQLRLGSTLAHIPERFVVCPPGMGIQSAVSGRSVSASADWRAVFGGNDMDRGCLPGGWRGKAGLRTSGRSSAITATTASEGAAGAASGARLAEMPAMRLDGDGVSAGKRGGDAGDTPAPCRLPVYRFAGAGGAGEGAGEAEAEGGGGGDGDGNGEGGGGASSSMRAVDVPADIFAQPLRADILHRVVRWQLARRQQGTHKTKTRSEVRGGGRKPWQQKGSGRARQGTIRAVQWRGGGTVHGPVVRSHAHDLPRKVRRLGLAVAVSAKLEEGRLVIVDRFTGAGEEERGEEGGEERGEERGEEGGEEGGEAEGARAAVAVENKTQEMVRRIDGLFARAEVPVTRRSVLMVDGTGGLPASVVKSTRNIPWVDVIPVVGLNVYSILQRDVLVMTRDAVNGLVARLHAPIKR